MQEREIFLSALEIEDPNDRQAHLQTACGDDPELLGRVQALLESHEGQSQFLNTPAIEQITEQPESAPTMELASGSTEDGDLNPAAFIPDGRDRIMNINEQDDEIPLGYLQPSSDPDSLGRLGHYEILEVIGSGAFGTVLKAFDEKLHRVVAIKVLALAMASTSPARKRFLREARSSAAVRHDNVVSIYAVEDEPIPYLVMEYIPGLTLQQRLDGTGPLDIQEALRIGKQIADGLAAAHARDLIHRDIKPGNILLDTSVGDHVKITDFGLARTADDASMTQSGMIAGTPLYMAPEQAQGQKLDQRADLFSFGSVLYQMLSGRPPFRAPNTVAVLKRVVEDAPRPIREIIPEVPEWICELIGHLHAKDPGERYGSAKEVSDLLAQCLLDVQEGRRPRIPAPSTAETVLRSALTSQTQKKRSASKKALPGIAAVVALLFVCLGLTEATSVTNLSSTVIRMLYGSGTLVIEASDPSLTIAINGEQVTIRGAGVDELTLSPGKYRVEAVKDGQTVQQELVSISRNGRTVVRMSLEPSPAVATGEEIDLIQLLEPARDFRDDRLKIQDGKLITPQFKNPGAIGMIPYGPVPAEYDIRLRLKRLSNHFAGFNFGIVVGGRQVCVGMDCGIKEKVWGLDFVDGVPAHRPENPTRNPGRRLIVGQVGDVTIQVRKNHITASCDGEVLIDWTGDPERLSVYSGFDIPESDSMFFVAQADFIVEKMALIPRGDVESRSESSARPAAPPLAKAPFSEEEAKQHQQAWADYLGVPVEKEFSLGRNRRGEDVTLSLVLIPPGEFLMGSSQEEIDRLREQAPASGLKVEDVGRINLEGPQRRVQITRPFYVSRNEFTTDQFRSFVQAQPGEYKTEPEASGKGAWAPKVGVAELDTELNWKRAGKFPQGSDSPVVNVTWNDANDCCEWLSQLDASLTFALPTEAQWEYACRAGTTTLWSTGDERSSLEGYAVFKANWPKNIGDRLPNAFGLCDMHGNVWEWCQDAFYDYRDAGSGDPLGNVSGEFRIIRGGSCFEGTGITRDWQENSGCRSAARDVRKPDNPLLQIGFRVTAAISDGVISERSQARAGTATDADDEKTQQSTTDGRPPMAIAPSNAEQAKQHQRREC